VPNHVELELSLSHSAHRKRRDCMLQTDACARSSTSNTGGAAAASK
jgi:hypothetical protein